MLYKVSGLFGLTILLLGMEHMLFCLSAAQNLDHILKWLEFYYYQDVVLSSAGLFATLCVQRGVMSDS